MAERKKRPHPPSGDLKLVAVIGFVGCAICLLLALFLGLVAVLAELQGKTTGKVWPGILIFTALGVLVFFPAHSTWVWSREAAEEERDR